MNSRVILRWAVLLVTVGLIACANSAASPTNTTSQIAPAVATPRPAFVTTPTLSVPARPPGTLGGTPGAAPTVSGKFVFAPGDGSIWVQDAASGRAQPVVKASAEYFTDSPAFSPDGKRIAYVSVSFTPDKVLKNSIQLIDTDGKNPRTVAAPNEPKARFYWPSFSPGGEWIYYTAIFPVQPTGERSEIHRVPVEGGAPEKVLDDARLAVLSRDAKRIAFVRFNPDRFTGALWTADADGQNARQLVAEDVFQSINAPRFSPDGQWILFAASGPPSRALPGAIRECEPSLLCALAQPAYANGLPWDMWLVSADGSRFQQLTQIGADSPWPAWSHDGRFIAIFQTTGIYLLDVSERVLSKLNGNGGHGVFDWWSE